MNETASVMKNEIRMIAGYRALIISKYYFLLLLGMLGLFLAQKNLAASPLYVLLILSTLPPIISYALNDYAKKITHRLLIAATKDPQFKLKQLKSKYRYTRIKYVSNSVTYVFALLLICLWQVNYSNTMQAYPFLIYIPLVILISGLLVRLLGVVFYRFKLPYDLRHNKL